MNELAWHGVELLFISGFYLGLIKSKLDGIKRVEQNLDDYMKRQNEMLINSATVMEKLSRAEDAIEQLNDRFDVHDIAIRNLEISTAKWKN